MKILILIIVLMIQTFALFAQDFNNYVPISCQNAIPNEIINPQKLLSTNLGAEIKVGDSYTTIKGKKQFVEMSSFYIENFLRSGDILFNNEISDYVNKVADNVLKNHPEIRNSLHFFVTKYPEVNAACLNNGIVIVNIGLLAQLENEAQLAYIIAHEVVHFVKKHGINSYLEGLIQTKKNSRKGYYSNENRVFAMLQYSKDLEFEADDEGFTQYYAPSGYKLSEAERVCDVLLYSDFPVDEIEFSRSEIEDSLFKLESNNWLDSVEPINVIEDYDDSEMSHPNIKKRRTRLIEKIEAEGDHGQKYLLGKEEFLKIRQMARFELCQLYIQQKKFPEAIYLTYILQKEFPNSNYLLRIKAAAYYGLVLYNNRGYSGKLIKSTREQKGESQRLFYMLKSLKKKDLNVLSAREIWKLHMQNPKDTFIIDAFEFVLGDIFSQGYYAPSFFNLGQKDGINNKDNSEKTGNGNNEANVNAENQDEREGSKYTRIKEKQNKALGASKDAFANAFSLYGQDSIFRRIFNTAKLKYKDPEKEVNDFISDSHQKKKKKKKENKSKVKMSNVIVLNPIYLQVSVNRNQKDVLYKSNEKRPILIDAINNASKHTGIKSTLLDISQFASDNIDEYNDYQILTTWLEELSIPDEFADHIKVEDTEKDSAVFLTPNIDRIKNLCEKYNTRYIVRTGVLKVKSNKLPLATYAGIFSIYTLPFSIVYACLPRYHYYYFFSVYDLLTGEIVYSEGSKMTSTPNLLSLESRLFNSFKSIQK